LELTALPKGSLDLPAVGGGGTWGGGKKIHSFEGPLRGDSLPRHVKKREKKGKKYAFSVRVYLLEERGVILKRGEGEIHFKQGSLTKVGYGGCEGQGGFLLL